MSEIPTDWSLAALLLFGAMFTALSAGATILLAELPVLPHLEMLSSLAQCFKPTLGERPWAFPMSGRGFPMIALSSIHYQLHSRTACVIGGCQWMFSWSDHH
jgi:hypothetical protein